MGLAAVASIAAFSFEAGAHAGTPALVWRDAQRLGVQCVVQGGPGVDHLAVAQALCERVRAAAADAAPVPVSVIPIGDPALMAPGTAVLLVQAAVQPAAQTAAGGQGQVLVFSVRPFRASAEQTEVLYGAAPRAAPLTAAGRTNPALDAAVRATLNEVLPWRKPAR